MSLTDAELAEIEKLVGNVHLSYETIRRLVADLRAERAESAKWQEKYLAERDEGVRAVKATILRADELIEAGRAETARLRAALEQIANGDTIRPVRIARAALVESEG